MQAGASVPMPVLCRCYVCARAGWPICFSVLLSICMSVHLSVCLYGCLLARLYSGYRGALKEETGRTPLSPVSLLACLPLTLHSPVLPAPFGCCPPFSLSCRRGCFLVGQSFDRINTTRAFLPGSITGIGESCLVHTRMYGLLPPVHAARQRSQLPRPRPEFVQPHEQSRAIFRIVCLDREHCNRRRLLAQTPSEPHL
ncbi:unnamed protein product [Protopolystoma xenopodis]|uniref:Uncharacterized protein n=1 Tax=Protopolystoma xenopodis TaxID=117903 RepID=A0A3S5CK17_9PLAT|nr:unnamed protein product [Protopolystoma xenopodis]